MTPAWHTMLLVGGVHLHVAHSPSTVRTRLAEARKAGRDAELLDTKGTRVWVQPKHVAYVKEHY